MIEARAVCLGGHSLKKVGKVYKCVICNSFSKNWEVIAPARCKGSLADQWERTIAEFVKHEAHVGKGHLQKLSDSTIWCARCGAHEGVHGASATASLSTWCKGNPRGWAKGATRGKQLERMRSGMHPTLPIPLNPLNSEECKIGTSPSRNLTIEQRNRRNSWITNTWKETRRSELNARSTRYADPFSGITC